MTRVRLIVFGLGETLVHATEVPLSYVERVTAELSGTAFPVVFSWGESVLRRMMIKLASPVNVLLLIAYCAIVPNALACSPGPPYRPVVEITPKDLLSVFRATYRQAGFEYVKQTRSGHHVQMHFRFALREFPDKEKGKLGIAVDLGTGKTCNPCRFYLIHMNVGDDYSPTQYSVAQRLVNQKHALAESELVRRLQHKLGAAPTAACASRMLGL